MTEKDTGTNFIIGFMVGTAIGAAIGFLYAPKTGRETRALLKEKAMEAKEKTGEVAEKAKEAAIKDIEHHVSNGTLWMLVSTRGGDPAGLLGVMAGAGWEAEDGETGIGVEEASCPPPQATATTTSATIPIRTKRGEPGKVS